MKDDEFFTLLSDNKDMFFSCHERGTKRKSEVPTTTGSKI